MRNAVSTSLRQPCKVNLEQLGRQEGQSLPLNTHGIGKGGKQPPFIGKVVSIERLGGRDKERDVSHIVIETGGVEFVEGQSFGVQPPVSNTPPPEVNVPPACNQFWVI